MRLEASILTGIPDAGRGWILKATLRARRLVAELNPDVVVSSGPPHSAHVVAYLATRGRRSKWFADLRDPWAGPVAKAWLDFPFYRSSISRALNLQLEKLSLRSASGILCTTQELADYLKSRYAGNDVHWIPNGVDHESLPDRGDESYSGLAVSHVGTLYVGRDPSLLLRAFRRFLDADEDALSDGSMIRLVGHIEDAHTAILRDTIAELRLHDHVRLLGVVPRDEALKVLARSQIGVVFAQDQDFQIPAKIYEPLALGIDTVVIAGPESAAGREARRLGAAVIDPGDEAGLFRYLQAARVREPSSGTQPIDRIYQSVLANEVDSLVSKQAPEA
jgi:glycosyltransferase involved in cell wall biosynthesis